MVIKLSDDMVVWMPENPYGWLSTDMVKFNISKNCSGTVRLVRESSIVETIYIDIHDSDYFHCIDSKNSIISGRPRYMTPMILYSGVRRKRKMSFCQLFKKDGKMLKHFLNAYHERLRKMAFGLERWDRQYRQLSDWQNIRF